MTLPTASRISDLCLEQRCRVLAPERQRSGLPLDPPAPVVSKLVPDPEGVPNHHAGPADDARTLDPPARPRVGHSNSDEVPAAPELPHPPTGRRRHLVAPAAYPRGERANSFAAACPASELAASPVERTRVCPRAATPAGGQPRGRARGQAPVRARTEHGSRVRTKAPREKGLPPFRVLTAEPAPCGQLFFASSVMRKMSGARRIAR
jgi:hypothetical protein